MIECQCRDSHFIVLYTESKTPGGETLAHARHVEAFEKRPTAKDVMKAIIMAHNDGNVDLDEQVFTATLSRDGFFAFFPKEFKYHVNTGGFQPLSSILRKSA